MYSSQVEKGPKSLLPFPTTREAIRANFSPKNILTHSMREFGARTQKTLALMTVDTVGKYSILSL